MSLRWLFLDLNSYFASVEQAENPALRERPVAVVPMLADTTCCIAASYEAKAYGVKTGTSVKDAKELCPGIVFIEACHRKYTHYHKKIVQVVETCLPVSQVLSIDEMACELIGREKTENIAREKAQQIKAAIYKNVSPALSCSIGIAPNKFLAKVASDMQKPNGLTVVHAHDIPKIFFKLKPRDFPGIGPRMEMRLLKYRCLSVEKLYQFSCEEMRAIWGGVLGEQFWRMLRGENLQERPTSKRTIGHSHVLAPKLRTRQDAWAVCVRLLSKACMRLREAQYYACELQLAIKFTSRTDPLRYWSDHSRFPQTQDTYHMIQELEKLWLKVPQKKILRVGVTLSKLIAEQQRQLSLFENYKSKALMSALDKLNRKYNHNIICFASALSAREIAPGRIAFQHIPEDYE